MKEPGAIVNLCRSFNERLWRVTQDCWQEATDAGYADLLLKIWGKPRHLFKALLQLSQTMEPDKDTLPLPAIIPYSVSFTKEVSNGARFDELCKRLEKLATFLHLFFYCTVSPKRTTPQNHEILFVISLLDEEPPAKEAAPK